MKKYNSIVWLVLCLGFTGNVAFGENENLDFSEDQGVVAPLADNKTAAQALVEFVTIARSELEGHLQCPPINSSKSLRVIGFVLG